MGSTGDSFESLLIAPNMSRTSTVHARVTARLSSSRACLSRARTPHVCAARTETRDKGHSGRSGGSWWQDCKCLFFEERERRLERKRLRGREQLPLVVKHVCESANGFASLQVYYCTSNKN